MKIFFVGMHNKPMMKPLDSKTKSGAMIDKVIAKLKFPNVTCVKTNLFDEERMPSDEEIKEANTYWWTKYEPASSDIIVLLGGWVKKSFEYGGATVVGVPHPASRASFPKIDYVDSVSKKIKDNILQTKRQTPMNQELNKIGKP